MAALGRFEDAFACNKKALALNPDCAEAQRGVVGIGKLLHDSERARLEEIVADPKLAAHQRISAGFALGALHDKAGEYDCAFNRAPGECDRLAAGLGCP